MNLKSTKPRHISQESLDSLIKTYQEGRMTHEAFIDAIILNQKRLIIKDFCGGHGGIEGEIFLRRMSNSGIEITV